MTISQYPQFNCFNFYIYSKLINNVITRLLRKSAKRLPINGMIRYALTDGTYLSHKACILAMAFGVAESIVTGLMNMVQGMVGEKGRKYVPYLTTVMLYIGVSNIIGLFGFKSPTKDLRVTVALALMSIILIEAAGIYHKGVKRWLHGFVEPVAIVTPINILEVVTKPLSLCMRLFGNVLGAFVIMELLKMILPVGLPVVFSLYFDIFDGLLQAYVFVFLTSLYIDEITE